jgi:microcystin-dependent protein
LAAIVGATTPDLKGRFALGDNASLSLLGTGGSLKILEGNLPNHSHTFSGTTAGQNQSHTHTVNLSDPGHGHGISDPGHSHVSTATGYELGSSDWVPSGSGPNWGYDVGTGAATTGVSVNSGSTGVGVSSVTNASQDHTHTYSGTTVGAGSGNDYYQPYLVVNYIIKHD